MCGLASSIPRSIWTFVKLAIIALAMVGPVGFVPSTVIGAERGQSKLMATEPTTTNPQQATSESTGNDESEIYMGLYMLGSNTVTRPLKVEGDAFPMTSVDGGVGGGLKVGAYPAFTGRFIGIEGELYGFRGEVVAPQTTIGGVTRSAAAKLNVINAMANLLLRYPGELFQPYLGVGVGLSGGFLRGINIQHSQLGNITENAGDAAFAYQFLGGARVILSDRWFLFGEYKYLLANYKWESDLPSGAAGPSSTLNFRTHLVSGGIGFRF